MWEYLLVIGLAVAPISEARGAIVYGLGAGLNPYLVFLLAVLSNIIIIPAVFWGLKQAHLRKIADKLFAHKMHKRIEKHKDALNKYGFWGLLIFTAVPLPVTGGWTAAFIAEILEINKKRALLAISIGIVIAALIVSLGAGGTIFLLDKLIA